MKTPTGLFREFLEVLAGISGCIVIAGIVVILYSLLGRPSHFWIWLSTGLGLAIIGCIAAYLITRLLPLNERTPVPVLEALVVKSGMSRHSGVTCRKCGRTENCIEHIICACRPTDIQYNPSIGGHIAYKLVDTHSVLLCRSCERKLHIQEWLPWCVLIVAMIILGIFIGRGNYFPFKEVVLLLLAIVGFGKAKTLVVAISNGRLENINIGAQKLLKPELSKVCRTDVNDDSFESGHLLKSDHIQLFSPVTLRSMVK